jgi:hypothetical protein
VAAATAATTTATTAGEAARRTGRTTGASGSENGKLNGRFHAGALGAGNFLLFVDNDFFETLVAGIADVLVNGHDESLSKQAPGFSYQRKL